MKKLNKSKILIILGIIILAFAFVIFFGSVYFGIAFGALGIFVLAKGIKAKKAAAAAEAQTKSVEQFIADQTAEYAARNAAAPLAPEEIDGHKLKYHYTDVQLRVPWELSGRYDVKPANNVVDLGIKRGDALQFSFDPVTLDEEVDPENVVIFWHNTKIGEMRKTRLRNMMKEWSDAGMPIFCAMFWPSKSSDFFIELGFYGRP